MSFIPPKCTSCGGPLTRISNVCSDLACVDCRKIFNLLEVKN